MARVLSDIEKHVKALSVEALTDAKVLWLERPGKPLLKSLLYELVDHPLHHFVKLYRKYDKNAKALETLARLHNVLAQPGTSKWTATSRNKIKKHEKTLQA